MADTFSEGVEVLELAADTFVVRIFSRDGSKRGQIQHVRSRNHAYFATRQRLLTFIQDNLAERRQCPN